VIKLDGGIILPTPIKAKGFERNEKSGISDWKWRQMKPDMWRRAYLHCLYTLPLHFDDALHSVVPKLAANMLEASEPKNVALRFIGEMELAGYVRFERGMDERIVVPTKKFLKLELDINRAEHGTIRYPKLLDQEIPESPIRNGVSDDFNKEVTSITTKMASEVFEINRFIKDLVDKYPPEFKKLKDKYMFDRSTNSVDILLDQKFRFPYFSDGRGRHYTDTTCGFNPQGADHEKAIVIPTYAEPLTESGFDALIETAHGYSEIEWDVWEMMKHANKPEETKDTWMQADKPYCYMACAYLVRQYILDPSKPLPAFIPLDGRCSGLQHWSAVIRSNAITRHLGMHEEEAELDIYEKIAHDWKQTLSNRDQKYATRKAAKIPVMTWGYNATMMTSMEHMDKLFGASQVWDAEQGAYVRVGKGIDRKEAARLGVDLYKGMQDTLGPLQGAVDWVSKSAHKIASIGNANIKWITPDGFTCQQRKIKGVVVDINCTLSDGSRFQLDIKDFDGCIPNSAKHKSAIAPNIIHSLDATHLRMVARRLDKLGLPMIFIHDSFATHCNYRDVLYKIIVEEFVKLYDTNYLAELKEYWEYTYRIELDESPDLGDWKPQSIQGLTQFFV